MADPFELVCDALGTQAILSGFKGREAISQPFHFDVFVSLPLEAVPEHAALVGQPLTLTVVGGVDAGDDQPTHGLVVAFEVIDEAAERALLRLEVRPRLFLLGLSRHARVFTGMKVPDILEEVLAGAGLTDYELRLSRDYPVRPHVSQYKESDLAFLERLMEHDGIYYFFEHTSSAHKLVIADDSTLHAPSRPKPVRYHPVQGGDLGSDLFVTVAERRRLRPKLVRLTDYDYTKPALDVKGEQAVSDHTGAEVVVHGVGALDPGDAGRLAQVRKEELLAAERVFELHGSAFHLRSGGAFDVSDHPRDAVNASYLCTELEHVGNARIRGAELSALTGIARDVVYEVRAWAILANVVFRPPRLRHAPRVPGFERGTVDGPADSDYAQLDADGRYYLKLGWDESDRKGDKSSVRTRMMQPHAGNPEGMHLPLRKATEVLVAFIGGDPDRPVIAGAVPNAETPSVVTSSNHTRNIFHSGGDNHIEIEDQDGGQWVDVRSPTQDSRLHLGTPHDDDSHYVVEHTDADCRFTIGGNQDIRVGGNLTEEVKGNVFETYNTSQTSNVTGPQKTTVFGAVEETYQSGHKTTVTGKVTEIYCSGQQTDVSGARSETYMATQKTVVVGGTTHTYDSQDMKVMGANSTQSYIGPRTVTVNGDCKYTFDGSVNQLFGPTTYICPTLDWTVEGSASFFTPSWTKIYVSLNDVSANVVYNDLLEIKCYGMAVALISPLKSETVGISIGANGFKFSDAIINAGTYIGKLTIRPLHISTKVVKLTAAPFIKSGC